MCMSRTVKCRPKVAYWVQIDGNNIATELITRYYSNETCWANVCDACPTLNQHWINVQCLRESPPTQQTQNICITFIQRRPKVLCLLGVNTSSGSGRFHIPAVIQSVCLQANDQVGARAKGFELLTHRCRSSIYELAVIWELALNEALGMKRILSIIME